MSNHNYTQDYKRVKDVVEEAVEEVVEEHVAEPPIEPAVDVVTESLKIGIVVDCANLRLREQPNTDAEVVREIKRDTLVQVDESTSTDEFYKIYLANGAEGYCMKKFIAVN